MLHEVAHACLIDVVVALEAISVSPNVDLKGSELFNLSENHQSRIRDFAIHSVKLLIRALKLVRQRQRWMDCIRSSLISKFSR